MFPADFYERIWITNYIVNVMFYYFKLIKLLKYICITNNLMKNKNEKYKKKQVYCYIFI